MTIVFGVIGIVWSSIGLWVVWISEGVRRTRSGVSWIRKKHSQSVRRDEAKDRIDQEIKLLRRCPHCGALPKKIETLINEDGSITCSSCEKSFIPGN
jgi:hypothetical protein